MSHCSVLLFLQSGDSVSKSLWTNVCTFKLYPQCIPQSSRSKGYELWRRGNNAKWHLAILLAQLGGFYVSHLHWEQLSRPKYPCFPADVAASLKLLFFCLGTQSQEEGQGFESWRALLGGSGQSFPDLWVCVEWVATVMLRFYWGFFVVGVFFPPTPSHCQLLKSTAELLVAL